MSLSSETDWLDLRAESLEMLARVGGPTSALDDALELTILSGNVVAAARITESRSQRV